MQTYEENRLPHLDTASAATRSRGIWLHPAVLFLLGLLASVGGGAVGGMAALMMAGSGGFAGGLAAGERGLTQLTLVEDSAVINVVRQVSPAVVTVVTELPPQRTPSGRRFRESSSGSGVIIDRSGYIITNEHVVRDAQSISVILSDGRKLPAEVIGTDAPFTDLAVIRVVGENLTMAEIGDSDALISGQRVIAIGSALGDFHNTITMGIVSGLHRTWRGENVVMEDLIQTDAAINNGNSGGPLVNTVGQIIGINTSVIRATEAGESVEGIGFAIPSNTVREVGRQLMQRGRVIRPDIGIVQQQVSPSLASLYGLPVRQGAFVIRIRPNSPAERAGIVEGDIITKIGGNAVDAEHPFLNVLMLFGPNDKVTLTVNRSGKELGIDITLAEKR